MLTRISLLTLFLIFSGVTFAQEDSADCYSRFFGRTTLLANPAKTVLVDRGKTTTFQALQKMYNAEGLSYVQSGLIDLDNDGKKELVVYIYSGGAHCCDGYTIYTPGLSNKYNAMARTFGGNACFNEKNELEYSFYENFGYFYTCYACALDDTTDTAPLSIQTLRLKYSKGKLQVVPGDQELKATILDNLGKFSERPFENLPDLSSFDNGLRKEYALNLAVYYFSFGKNLLETQKLFNKYYKFPDAKKVWASFVGTLNDIKKDNSF
jgi:hypothetical protein